MLRHTDLVFGFAEEGSGKLIAFARVLTDRVYRAFIFDVIVAPAHRGEGLGAALVEHILSHPVLAKVESFQLTCKPDMMPFYGKYGFRRPEQVFMARSSTS
ncbi:hypothetical protein F183_A06370 [Bryobacterales bacterium F-183]|nr:hypothetical protein F183_A06370 [Bryobacterales bacterium F-183]